MSILKFFVTKKKFSQNSPAILLDCLSIKNYIIQMRLELSIESGFSADKFLNQLKKNLMYYLDQWYLGLISPTPGVKHDLFNGKLF